MPDSWDTRIPRCGCARPGTGVPGRQCAVSGRVGPPNPYGGRAEAARVAFVRICSHYLSHHASRLYASPPQHTGQKPKTTRALGTITTLA